MYIALVGPSRYSRNLLLGRKLLCFWFALLGIAEPGSVRADNFKTELKRILATHPLIKSAQATKDANIGLVEDAEGRFWPQVRFEGTTGPQLRSNPERRALERPEDFERRLDRTSLVITQSLFAGYENQSRLDASRKQVQSSSAAIERIRQQVLLEGINVYLEVLLNQKLIAVSLQNERNILEQAELEDERVKRGTGITLDVLQAKSRLALGKQARLNFEGEFRKARARYLQVFGVEPSLEVMKNPELPKNMVPTSLDDALALSQANNPSVIEFEFIAQGLADLRDAERGNYWPKIDLVSTLAYKANEGTTAGHERSADLLLRGTWDLFSGFSTRGRVQSAAKSYQSVQQQTANQRRKINEQVRVTWEELFKQKERLIVLKNAVDIQAEVFEQRKILREEGNETNLAVLDAKTELFEAQLELIQAEFAYRIAAFALGSAVGLLTNDVLGL